MCKNYWNKKELGVGKRQVACFTAANEKGVTLGAWIVPGTGSEHYNAAMNESNLESYHGRIVKRRTLESELKYIYHGALQHFGNTGQKTSLQTISILREQQKET